MLAIQENNTNIVPFKTIDGGKNNEPKLKKDGTEKQIPNNNAEDRWVNPIRDKEDIKRILNYLHDQAGQTIRVDTMMAAYRNELLFAIGINVGLRVSDLITLKWKNIFEEDMKTFKDASRKREQKTGKTKDICPNNCMKRYIMEYLSNTGIQPQSEEYVFISSRKDKNGKFKPITDATVERMMKDIQKNCKLGFNVNTHSLRKSYSYHLYMYLKEKNDPFPLEKVQKALNHRNSSDTLRYLGLTRDEQIKNSMELGEYWNL